MELKEMLKEMTNTMGVSGDEFAVSKLAEKFMKPYVDKISTDDFGNVVGKKSCGVKNAPVVLLDAHIDQIGFWVTEVTDTGFLRFADVGVDPRMLPGSELLIKTKSKGIIPGIVATIPPHLQKAGDNTKSLPIDKMVVDIGMDGEKAKSTVSVGDYMCFACDTQELLGDVLCGKAMDDRACYASIIHAMQLLKDEKLGVDIITVGSVQEEYGLKGAYNLGYQYSPDYAIAIDVCHAMTGDSTRDQTESEMGSGPVITMGINSRPNFAKKVMEIARAKEIPYQVEVAAGRTGTNAWAYQTASENGTCTLVMSVPLKYMHSPVEVLKMSDVENTGKLLAEVLKGFTVL